ncbi:MAG: glutamate-5-semialdehyde dehydrogenase [Candidatus Micrarchaeia archaeon]
MQRAVPVADVKSLVLSKLERAKKASLVLAQLSTNEKNAILMKMADALEKNEGEILAANALDLKSLKVPESMKDRLMLNSSRLKAIASDVRSVALLPDPIGEKEGKEMKNGLRIAKVRVPFGVIGVIYESRPNVTADVASLCIKSGNACVLRGSASALNSNRAIAKAISSAVPEGAVELIDTEDRSAVDVLMNARGYLDIIIPRGGKELISHVVGNSKVPVIETGEGNCHIFVDESADLGMAERIIINAKCQRPSVCNAAEKVLVHERIAGEFLPILGKKLKENGVELRICEKSAKILGDVKVPFILATGQDWGTEYLDLIIGIKIVGDVDEAISHINKYNTKHTEAIITKSDANAKKFVALVDAAAIMVNASTRFTDGGQFGMGAEIGISTQKMHARGPMGLRELTTYKYIVNGNGQIRS